MEHMPGRIFKDPFLPDMSPVERSAVYTAMCDVLVKIHSVNVEEAGLQDYGKPGMCFHLFYHLFSYLLFFHFCSAISSDVVPVSCSWFVNYFFQLSDVKFLI